MNSLHGSQEKASPQELSPGIRMKPSQPKEKTMKAENAFDDDRISRRIGYTLLTLVALLLLVAIARVNDQKRLVGYVAGHSLEASCAPGRAAFFTDGERHAVYLEKPDGRVAAQALWRGGEVLDLSCDPALGQVHIVLAGGERRIAVSAARSAGGRELALFP